MTRKGAKTQRMTEYEIEKVIVDALAAWRENEIFLNKVLRLTVISPALRHRIGYATFLENHPFKTSWFRLVRVWFCIAQ